MKNRYGYKDIANISDRIIMFDANIFIYMYYSPRPGQKEGNYSKIFKILLESKDNNNIKFAVNIFVISEIVNRALHIKFDNLEPRDKKLYYNSNAHRYDIKKYRDSEDGKKEIDKIYRIVKSKILPIFEIFNKHSYSKQDVANLLTQDKLDFNDKIIANLCDSVNCILFTDDFDFSETNIDILSANNKFFK